MPEYTDIQPCVSFAQYALRDFRRVPSDKSPHQHQQNALAKLSAWYGDKAQTEKGGILVLPTGGGKTFTATRFICSHPLSDGYKVLWLAHTHHLLEQAMNAFGSSVGSILEPKPELNVRMVSGAKGHCHVHQIKPTDDVVIGSLQAICKAVTLKHEATEEFLHSAKGRLMVVFDEAHHSPAPSYRRLLVQLREICPQMVLLGLTATPFHSDEKKAGWLNKLFPQLILYQVTANELMAARVLAKPIVEQPRTNESIGLPETDYARWVNTNQDIPEEIVTALANRRGRNEFIASYYAEHRKRLGKTIIFADRWYQCEAICTALRTRCPGLRVDAVFSHVMVDHSTPEQRNRRTEGENASVIRKFKSGELDVLVNVRMLTEGTDVPDAQSVFLTRQTTSRSLLMQMVGRAMRGPAVGGTENAYLVFFIDDWQQSIKWADYLQLSEGQAGDEPTGYSKRPPLQLISIDLVRRLTRQMESGVNVNAADFITMLPLGWYHVEFDAFVTKSDESEIVSQMVLVYEHDRPGFEAFIKDATDQDLKSFEDPAVEIEQVRPWLEMIARRNFPDCDNRAGVSLGDLFSMLRHIAQNEKAAPRFFGFEDRNKHDLDQLARVFVEQDCGPRTIDQRLRAEYDRSDLFWKAIFSRYDQFRSMMSACIEHIMSQGSPAPDRPAANRVEQYQEEVGSLEKQQVFERDRRCLCCQCSNRLRIDHIKARYHGGGHELENLQLLCATCNSLKGTRTIDFRRTNTPLTLSSLVIPDAAALQLAGDQDDATVREHLLRWVNFFYQCSAVQALEIEHDEDRNRLKLRLHPGNDQEWLRPYVELLRQAVQPRQTRVIPPRQDTGVDDDRPETDPAKLDAPLRLGDILEAIRDVEGFDVCVLNSNHRKVRDDLVLSDSDPYPFRRKLDQEKTVATWKVDRFFKTYPVFDSPDYYVQVLDANGDERLGNTKLRNLRDSYFI